MKEIPVTRNFDQTDIIGKLILRDDIEIPYNSIFTPGVKPLEYDSHGNITKFELLEISLIPGKHYREYLVQEKKLKK